MIVSFDPSGNFKEGLGTTGIALLDSHDDIKGVGEIHAGKFESAEEYWDRHIRYLEMLAIVHFKLEMVIEGFRLYNHKRDQQVNSQFETPQLIGAIRLWCYQMKVPLTIQYASEVKTRWSDAVLEKAGYIYIKNGRRYLTATNEPLNNHKTDALRHGLHYSKYKR